MIVSAEEFAGLRRSEVPAEYQRAGNEQASVEVWLSVLAQFPDLREWVAHNKTVPISVLERLAYDPDARVRATVASKRKLTSELQRILAQDPDCSVRERLACNSKCEIEVLRKLARDSEAIVRDAAVWRVRAIRRLAEAEFLA